jgi:hypothetical protein
MIRGYRKVTRFALDHYPTGSASTWMCCRLCAEVDSWNIGPVKAASIPGRFGIGRL